MSKKTYSADPKLPIGSNFCQCSGCGEYFNSELPFRLHRFGTHGKSRRCLTAAEMLEKGMAVSAKGYWVSKLREKPDSGTALPAQIDDLD